MVYRRLTPCRSGYLEVGCENTNTMYARVNYRRFKVQSLARFVLVSVFGDRTKGPVVYLAQPKDRRSAGLGCLTTTFQRTKGPTVNRAIVTRETNLIQTKYRPSKLKPPCLNRSRKSGYTSSSQQRTASPTFQMLPSKHLCFECWLTM